MVGVNSEHSHKPTEYPPQRLSPASQPLETPLDELMSAQSSTTYWPLFTPGVQISDLGKVYPHHHRAAVSRQAFRASLPTLVPSKDVLATNIVREYD